MKNLCSGSQCGGFQFLLILDLWGISFHGVVVFGLGKNFLFKSALGHCDVSQRDLARAASICRHTKVNICESSPCLNYGKVLVFFNKFGYLTKTIRFPYQQICVYMYTRKLSSFLKLPYRKSENN